MKAKMLYALRESIIYKHLKEQKFAEDMVQHGEIRIGTLYDFRNIEVGEERQDEEEGSDAREVEASFGWRELNNMNPLEREVIQRTVPSSLLGGRFDNCRFTSTEECRDCYVYCVSREITEESLQRLGRACVKIEQPLDFFKELTHSVAEARNVASGYVSPCFYLTKEDRLYKRRGDTPIPLKKGIRDQYQQEARIVWETTDEKIKPFFVTCPAVTKYCSIINL